MDITDVCDECGAHLLCWVQRVSTTVTRCAVVVMDVRA